MKRLQRSNTKRVQSCKTNAEEPSNHKKQKTAAPKPWLVVPALDEEEKKEEMKQKMVQLRKICRLPSHGERFYVGNISPETENDSKWGRVCGRCGKMFSSLGATSPCK